MEHTIANRQKLMQDQARAYGRPTCAPTSPLASTPPSEELRVSTPDELGAFRKINELLTLRKRVLRLQEQADRFKERMAEDESISGSLNELLMAQRAMLSRDLKTKVHENQELTATVERTRKEITRLNLKVGRVEALNETMTEDRDYWKREVGFRTGRKLW